ncbi:MAG: 6-bladed beta-propeller, partial [Marinilabiliaceae bacterium]|nr:6-bladed beta-propeller [Marinilabiliaceae bacterium]
MSLVIGITISILSCKNSGIGNEKLKTIDIESNINNFDELNLKSINAEIQYIPLELKEDLLLRGAYYLDINEEYILVSDAFLCLLYDINGKFISKIGQRGRGPGEYSGARMVKLGSEKIFIKGQTNMFEYSY